MNSTRFFRTALLACTTMALTALFTPVRATEGMWIPALLQAVAIPAGAIQFTRTP